MYDGYLFIFIDNKNELVLVLEKVLSQSDDSFKVKTPSTIEARKCAEKLLAWCLDNKNISLVDEFSITLTNLMEKVISASSSKSFTHNNEKLWRNFFLLRSSQSYVDQWSQFLKTADVPVKAVLFQHLTDVLFRKLLNDHFQVHHVDVETDTELNNKEKGVLRYVAGYICRHLRQKLEREGHEFKEEMVLCLLDLVKGNDTEQPGTDEEWIDLLDRGGLWHVKENTYQFFRAIEDVIRGVLPKLVLPNAPEKSEIIKEVTSDNDVQFYWLIATADFDVDDYEVHDTLLLKIVELYVTVRGFSLASGWLEKYKQCTRKSTQRTKSLRREIHDSTTV